MASRRIFHQSSVTPFVSELITLLIEGRSFSDVVMQQEIASYFKFLVYNN